MNISLAKKLTGSFLIMAVLVLAACLTGIFMVKKVARSGERVVMEEVPVKDVAMEATIVLEGLISNCRKYIHAEEGLKEIDAAIKESLGDFDMFVAMIEFGSGSDEFKESPAGAMYVKDGMTIRVPRGNPAIQDKITVIRTLEQQLTEQVGRLQVIHAQKVEYLFRHDGVHYDLAGFMYRASIKYQEWFKALSEAVEYGADFSGELNPLQSFYGRWNASYRTSDEKLKDLLKRFGKTHAALHQFGASLVAAPAGQQSSMLIRGGRYLSSAERGLAGLAIYAEKAITILDDQELSVITEVFKATDAVKEQLSQVEEQADMVMNQALAANQETTSSAVYIVVFLMIVSVVIALVLALSINRGIIQPLKQAVVFAEQLSTGDFTQILDVRQKDEVGAMTSALNRMVNNLKGMIGEVITSVESLASSTELDTIAGRMSDGSDNTAGKANNVAASAEELNANLGSVAATMEEATTNLSTMASGTEEMSATIGEVAKQAGIAKEITDRAVAQGKSASERIDELGAAADEIGKVTETINAISSQTNLLALNATIEAARAGEAGKGFAVVASEIKGLAQQTATATDEIAAKIKGIQDSTKASVSEINEISRINDQVDEIVTTIAAAVEEQAATTREIAGNVTQASQGLAEVNENVAQTSAVSGTIAQDIAEVNEAAGAMSKSSD
ncbi:MAG: methyl-accepting chemotaxis protein, partial [Pseudomonadota bacterium]|nr:methyl-accepting chemotaxis protein [Pseudomonadota bacterium]